MQLDLTSSSPIALTRLDGYLLLLAAHNSLLFRDYDKWSSDDAVESEIVSRAARSIESAMWRIRKESHESMQRSRTL